MGSSKETTTTREKSDVGPWAPSQPGLKGLLRQAQKQIGNTPLTDKESGALDQLEGLANTPNQYAGQVDQLAGDLLSGGTDRTGILTDAYGDYQRRLNPIAEGAGLDVGSNPQLQAYLDTITSDVTDSVNSQFGSAGRSMSPSHVQALARGIGMGTAPTFYNAYRDERSNQIGAIGDLYSGAHQQAEGLSGLDRGMLQNRMAGIDVADKSRRLEAQPANEMLLVEAQRRGLPVQNLQQLANLMVPIGGLGSKGDRYSWSQTEQKEDPVKAITGGIMQAAGLVMGNPGAGQAFGSPIY